MALQPSRPSELQILKVAVHNSPQVEEAALQVSIDNSYLDLDLTIVDLCEGGSLDPTNRKTILILRTSLSVRVHNCCGEFFV